MSDRAFSVLPQRGLVRLSGDDVKALLQRLITTDMDIVERDGVGFGALLTPQGKILFDFIIAQSDADLWVDLPRAVVGDFIKRMTLYKLRADVTLTDCSDSHEVCVAPEGVAPDGDVVALFSDPRAEGLGLRLFRSAKGGEEDTGHWQERRIALGVPEVSSDFGYGDLFPHDAGMDHLNGLVFDKGCYVGQEVVSRMHHRGTARKRPVIVRGAGLSEGAELMGGDKSVGILGYVSGDHAVAIARLDRLKSALDNGAEISVAGAPVEVSLPQWAGYDWP
ncbi:YgfZ/GcvT domain-containing protein [Coralliovum pocilloporae]|uniref:CAF17-like 4Fe-4S cluster assembly/insertion protein YgfZ n=1 Tax=Coralliovum pocilloporae TaxID=3066369 RepID=UPI0033070AAE